MECNDNPHLEKVRKIIREEKEQRKYNLAFTKNVDFHLTNPRAKYQRGRRWMFTCNNPEIPSEQFLTVLKTINKARYVVFQLEKGQKGTPHYQGYIEFKEPIRRQTLCNVIKMWYSPARGTQKQCIAYCTKKDTQLEEPWEWGEPTKQGTRTDLISFRDEVTEGKTGRELLQKYPTIMAVYPGFYNLCSKLTRKHYQIIGREVILCIGEAGTGKTEYARTYAPYEDTWLRPVATNKWFDEYDGQSVAIFDDYGGGGSKYKLTDLLRLLHGWTETVPYKGGFTIWKPDTIILTTNYHPALWYNINPRMQDCGDHYQGYSQKKDRRASYKALARRFTQVIEFRINKKPRKYTGKAPNFFFDTTTQLHPEYVETVDPFELYFQQDIGDKFQDMEL